MGEILSGTICSGNKHFILIDILIILCDVAFPNIGSFPNRFVKIKELYIVVSGFSFKNLKWVLFACRRIRRDTKRSIAGDDVGYCSCSRLNLLRNLFHKICQTRVLNENIIFVQPTHSRELLPALNQLIGTIA